MKTFHLEIVTRESALAERSVVSINVPAEHGRLTVLARHQAFVCGLRAGEARIGLPEGTREVWRIGPGTLTVRDDRAVLLVPNAQKE